MQFFQKTPMSNLSDKSYGRVEALERVDELRRLDIPQLHWALLASEENLVQIGDRMKHDRHFKCLPGEIQRQICL